MGPPIASIYIRGKKALRLRRNVGWIKAHVWDGGGAAGAKNSWAFGRSAHAASIVEREADGLQLQVCLSVRSDRTKKGDIGRREARNCMILRKQDMTASWKA